jgi:hypothetical protein
VIALDEIGDEIASEKKTVMDEFDIHDKEHYPDTKGYTWLLGRLEMERSDGGFVPQTEAVSGMVEHLRRYGKDWIKPLKDKKINLFVCGPTVYDYSHLGHARLFYNFLTP